MTQDVFQDYFSSLSKSQLIELNKIITIVKAMVPDAIEVISYGVPGFKYQGQYLLGFAAFKNHFSLFPTSFPVEILKNKLSDFKTSKGTIQFNIDHLISEDLLKEIIQIRLDQIKQCKIN